MNKVRLIKKEVKRMGFGNVKYHTFKGRSNETLKFYTCTPRDTQITDLNWYMFNAGIMGSAKRIVTEKHPNGFLEILVRD